MNELRLILFCTLGLGKPDGENWDWAFGHRRKGGGFFDRKDLLWLDDTFVQ